MPGMSQGRRGCPVDDVLRESDDPLVLPRAPLALRQWPVLIDITGLRPKPNSSFIVRENLEKTTKLDDPAASVRLVVEEVHTKVKTIMRLISRFLLSFMVHYQLTTWVVNSGLSGWKRAADLSAIHLYDFTVRWDCSELVHREMYIENENRMKVQYIKYRFY